MIGMRAKTVALRAGNFVIIDLAGFSEHPERPLFDTGVLRIYLAAWRLDVEGYPIAGHEDARPDMREATSLIGERVLTDVVAGPDDIDAVFQFEDISLKVFPMQFTRAVEDVSDPIHCAAWTPSGHVLTAGLGISHSVTEAARSPLTARLTYMRDYEDDGGSHEGPDGELHRA